MKNLTAEQKSTRAVLQEAWDNPSFAKELQKSPQEAYKKASGKELKLPKGSKLEVHDQMDPDTIYINIPRKPDLSNMKLTDQQLERVAGGWTVDIDVDADFDIDVNF